LKVEERHLKVPKVKMAWLRMQILLMRK